MLKRLLLVAVATVFFALQLSVGSAWALNMDESIRTVKSSDGGENIVLTNKQIERGKRLFNKDCAFCHGAGRTKTNPNVSLGLESLRLATPPRDSIAGIADYLQNPTSYDGETNYEELHPNTARPDLWPSLRNYTEDDLEDVAGYILIQPELRGVMWGGGKVYN